MTWEKKELSEILSIKIKNMIFMLFYLNHSFISFKIENDRLKITN